MNEVVAYPMSDIQIYEWDNNWRHKYVVRFLRGNGFEIVNAFSRWCFEQKMDYCERPWWRSIAFADEQDRNAFLMTWVR